MRRMAGKLAALFLLLGIAVLLYTPLSAWFKQNRMERETTAFEQAAAQAQAPSTGDDAAADPYGDLLAEMQQYNAQLYENGQSGLTDAWSYEQPPFDFAEYGLPTDVMGILRIPAMDQELPVYLGATEENMAKGVAVLGQTSMPVGGVNTNCVIAGHRGYGSTPFFREIEKLQPGDFVYLTTYWGEKTYAVESTAIILPDDIDAVLIQPGRELLTLVTCHPYIEATHRYVVYCTAVEEEEPQAAQAPEKRPAESGPAPAQGKDLSSQRRIQLEQWLPFLAIPLVMLAIVILLWPQRRKKRSPERRSEADEKKAP